MIDEIGISNTDGIKMPWSDIVAVSVHKLDLVTRTLTYLVFGHECGEYLEFTDEERIGD